MGRLHDEMKRDLASGSERVKELQSKDTVLLLGLGEELCPSLSSISGRVSGSRGPGVSPLPHPGKEGLSVNHQSVV